MNAVQPLIVHTCFPTSSVNIFNLILLFDYQFQSISPNYASSAPHTNVTDKKGDWWKHAESVYDFHVKTIDGEDISLKQYE